tara:strand:- start:1126 stop:1749 length:624 start_codon:yes stop_codon:yes gene_type:complete
VANKRIKKLYRIGITGGIACGKSTVSSYFKKYDISIIDTDLIAREMVKKGQPALEEIKREFGNIVFDSNGCLDRKVMRSIIFSDENARKKLEKILHPKIKKETISQADKAQNAYQIIIIPLLTQSGLKEFVNRILVIDCSEKTQIKRLMKRDNESIEKAKSIIMAQDDRKNRLKIADDIISNEEEEISLEKKVANLHRLYIRLASKH